MVKRACEENSAEVKGRTSRKPKKKLGRRVDAPQKGGSSEKKTLKVEWDCTLGRTASRKAHTGSTGYKLCLIKGGKSGGQGKVAKTGGGFSTEKAA